MATLPYAHTHNLHVIIVDGNDERVEDTAIRNRVYSVFVNQAVTKKINMNGTPIEVQLLWERVPLSKNQRLMMGDLFICSGYSDMVLYNATQKLLHDIEKSVKYTTNQSDWKLVFHVSKLLERIYL
jgi:hypothetical protein